MPLAKKEVPRRTGAPSGITGNNGKPRIAVIARLSVERFGRQSPKEYTMKKHHGLYVLTALLLAAVFVFTGCPTEADSASSPSKKPATKVTLAPGSHGTAGDQSITGLTDGDTLVVLTGAAWFGVADGALVGSGHSSPADAIDDAEELDGVDTITGLTNGTTYSVYRYFATTLDSTNTIKGSEGTANTGGKNMIVDINAATLQTGETVTISAGASAGGASLVFLTQKPQLAEAAGPVSVHTRIKGNGSGGGLTYSLSAVAGSADLAAVTAADTYFIINNMSAEFTAAIKANTPATAVIVAAKSWGSANTNTITGLTSGKQVVQHRGKWYAASVGGTSATLAPAASLPAAITAAATNTTVIINLQIDEIYDVYKVFTGAGSGAIGNGASVDTTNKSSVVDISAINNASSGSGTLITINAGATNGATLYLTGVAGFSAPNNATAFSATTNMTGSNTLKVGTYTPNLYYSNASGDTFFKVTGDANGTGQIVRQ